MAKTLLYGLSAFFMGNALFMGIAPTLWYDTIPGVPDTGAFNSHFIRDVALSFAVSSLALAAGARLGDGRLALFGAAWPCLHALYHIWIWMAHRDTALDMIALTNLVGIQIPAWCALVAAAQLSPEEALA